MASTNVNRRDFIPFSADRTASAQIKDKATTATYYKPGELVITDDAGTLLTSATALKAVPAINIHMRGVEGKVFSNVRIAGKDIVGYTMTPYVAPQELVHTVDFGMVNTDVGATYQVKFTDDESTNRYCNVFSDQVSVTTKTAITKSALVDLFVDKINLRFKTLNTKHTTFYLEAANSGGLLVITTLHFGFDPIRDKYAPERYSVQVGEEAPLATILSNKTAALVTPATARMTRGAGSYYSVAQAEYEAVGFTNDVYGNVFPATPPPALINYQAKEFFADGLTANGYDIVTINYKIEGGDYTQTAHTGAVYIYLPLEDNDTSQVDGLDTSSIVKVLNKYIFTEYEVGKAITVS